jgi:tetratricopeptide (TPR) repeat protein
MSLKSKEMMCLGLTEQGKIHAVANNHDEALRYYREALRLAKDCKNADVFFHHTTQCIMESLEHTGAYDLVKEYCERSEDHYESLDISDPVLKKHRAANLERLAVAHLQLEEPEEARNALDLAVALAGKKILPVAEAVLRWLQRGLSVAPAQLKSLQKRHDYFIVNKADIRRDLAIELPPGVANHAQI